MNLSRQLLLVEFGPFAGGGSNSTSPSGVTGNIPNVATNRSASGPYNINAKEQRDRDKGVARRRDRLRELVREWVSNFKVGSKVIADDPQDNTSL